jgi:hypothetical protein
MKCSKESIIEAVVAAELESPDLAVKLIDWAVNVESDCDHAFVNKNGFSNLTVNNEKMNQIFALLVVHQYGYNAVASQPRGRHEGSLLSLKNSTKKQHVYNRALKLVEFIQKNSRMFKGTPLDMASEDFIKTDLYDKLDGLGQKIKKSGIYDPTSENCHYETQCKGIYWKHYYKLNMVVDGLKTKALQSRCLFIGSGDLEIFNANQGLLYTPEGELASLANAEFHKQKNSPHPSGLIGKGKEKKRRTDAVE